MSIFRGLWRPDVSGCETPLRSTEFTAVASRGSSCHETCPSGMDMDNPLADSFSDAARRHRIDAKHLAMNNRFQNAGHLLGFAAECLAKDVLQSAGIIIDKPSGLKEHFPKLGKEIQTQGRGRVMVLLSPIFTNPAFLQGWRAECRYEANLPPNDAQTRYHSWRADVDSLFTAAGIP
jgi:hypothetical protein